MKNKNLDIKNGLVMMVSVIMFTILGSWISSLLPNTVLGGSSYVMTFIMTFTALTGAVSHLLIGGNVNITALVVCIISALIGARFTALFANKVDAKLQNRVTGTVLCVLGVFLAIVNMF